MAAVKSSASLAGSAGEIEWRTDAAPPDELAGLGPDALFWLSWGERLRACGYTIVGVVQGRDGLGGETVTLRAARDSAEVLTGPLPRLADALIELTRPRLPAWQKPRP